MTRLFALNPTRTRHPFRDHIFEIAVMGCFFIIGVTLLVWPGAAVRSPVGRELSGWQVVWALMYVVGCPSALYGIKCGSNRWRVFGKTLAGTGMLMQGVAAITYALDPRALTYFMFGAACYLRAYAVAKWARKDLS